MNKLLSIWTGQAVWALTLLAGLALTSPRATAQEVCGDYGTSVTFAQSPIEAARQALQQEKLVFVLHVSGNFEESQFT
jgi:hypothetical protein